MLCVNEIGKVAIHGPLQKRLAAPKSRIVWIGPFEKKNSQHPYLIGGVMSAKLIFFLRQHSKKLESFFPANLSEAAQLSKRCSARCSTQLATIKQNHWQSDRV
jgi:hypothetical protein